MEYRFNSRFSSSTNYANIGFSLQKYCGWICAQPSPRPGLLGAFAHLVSPGDGTFANFALPGGRAFANPRGHSRAFDTHAVSYQNITTQKVLQETKQIGSSVKDMNKL